MSCAQCASPHEADFAAEMIIHFGGSEHIDNPGVLAVLKIAVCLDCCASRFNAPEAEMRELRNGMASSTAGRRCPQRVS